MIDDFKERVEAAYEAWLKEAEPDPKRRALIRFITDAARAQQLHVLIHGRGMTDDELRAWMRGDYDVGADKGQST